MHQEDVVASQSEPIIVVQQDDLAKGGEHIETEATNESVGRWYTPRPTRRASHGKWEEFVDKGVTGAVEDEPLIDVVLQGH